MKKLFLILIVSAFAAANMPATVQAADDKPKTEQQARSLPYRGKITAVDKTAKTVKVGERTFQITDTSRIVKAGKTATLDDAAVGEEVGLSYREGADKKLNIVTLRVGPRPEATPKRNEPKSQ